MAVTADPTKSLEDIIAGAGGPVNLLRGSNLGPYTFPVIPPEFMLFGNLIYEMSSWSRAIVIPLSIVHAMNPRRPVPAGFNLNELVAPGVPFEFPNNEGFFSWRNFFLKADKFLASASLAAASAHNGT